MWNLWNKTEISVRVQQSFIFHPLIAKTFNVGVKTNPHLTRRCSIYLLSCLWFIFRLYKYKTRAMWLDSNLFLERNYGEFVDKFIHKNQRCGRFHKLRVSLPRDLILNGSLSTKPAKYESKTSLFCGSAGWNNNISPNWTLILTK